MIRDVKFYKTTDGYCPVLDFIDGLSGKAARKVTWTLSLLEELESLPSTYLRNLSIRMGFGKLGFRQDQTSTVFSVFLLVIQSLY